MTLEKKPICVVLTGAGISAESGIPFSIIFTKADKLKPNAITQNVETYQQKLLETWEELPELYITSAERKEGGENILNFIEHTNKYLRNSESV